MSKRTRTREQNQRQQRLQKKQSEQRRQIVLIGSIVAGVIVIAVALFLIFRPAEPIDPAALAQPPTKTYPQADGNKLGSPDAPVTVVEFADYLCSHCQDYALNDEQAVIDTYVASGRVYYEYLSIAAEDPSQTRAIEATYCAGDQGALWPYRDLVYANAARTSGALGSDYLTAYARSLELDMGAFDQCLRSGKYGTVNAENLEKAAAANIPGTPTFMVNGTQASRVNLTQVIEAELAKTGSNP